VNLRWGDSPNAQLEAKLRFENTPHAVTALAKAQSLRQPKASARRLKRPAQLRCSYQRITAPSRFGS
jgi:hypothetical protein